MEKTNLYYYEIQGYASYDTGHEYINAYDNSEVESDFGVGEEFKDRIYYLFEHAKEQFKSEIDSFLRASSFRRKYRNINHIDNELTLTIKKFAVDSEIVEKYVNGTEEAQAEASNEISDLIYDLTFENLTDERIELLSEETETFKYFKEEDDEDEEDDE